MNIFYRMRDSRPVVTPPSVIVKDVHRHLLYIFSHSAKLTNLCSYRAQIDETNQTFPHFIICYDSVPILTSAKYACEISLG